MQIKVPLMFVPLCFIMQTHLKFCVQTWLSRYLPIRVFTVSLLRQQWQIIEMINYTKQAFVNCLVANTFPRKINLKELVWNLQLLINTITKDSNSQQIFLMSKGITLRKSDPQIFCCLFNFRKYVSAFQYIFCYI